MPGDHRRRGNGTVNLDALADIFWDARHDGRPITLHVDQEPHEATARLMAVLGVTIEVDPLMGAQGRAAADFRSSLARSMRRTAGGERVETCDECGTETDVRPVAHDPKCSTAAAVLTVEKPVPPPVVMVKGRDGVKRSSAERHADGSYTSGEMQRRFDAKLDAAATVTRCALDGCDWSTAGTAAECRDAARAHREQFHPALIVPRRVRKGLPAAPKPVDTDADIPSTETLDTPVVEPEMEDTEVDTAPPVVTNGDIPAPLTALEPPPPAAAASSGRISWTREMAIAAVQAFVEREGRIPGSVDMRSSNSLPALPMRPSIGLTFPGLIEAAGYTPPGRGRGKGSGRADGGGEPTAPSDPRADATPGNQPPASHEPEPVAAGAELVARPDESPTYVGQFDASGFGHSDEDVKQEAVSPAAFALGLTGDFHGEAQRTRAHAAFLRRQADSLDKLADAIDELAAA